MKVRDLINELKQLDESLDVTHTMINSNGNMIEDIIDIVEPIGSEDDDTLRVRLY